MMPASDSVKLIVPRHGRVTENKLEGGHDRFSWEGLINKQQAENISQMPPVSILKAKCNL